MKKKLTEFTDENLASFEKILGLMDQLVELMGLDDGSSDGSSDEEKESIQLIKDNGKGLTTISNCGTIDLLKSNLSKIIDTRQLPDCFRC